ncbi:MAG: iron uptake transporter permease EfeU [Acidimicrobiia bacterium]
MLTTFVIGLREGLEAALIVGIVAAFLVRNGDRRAIRAMWVGVGLAVAACLGVAFALNVAGQRLPLTARAAFEGILALVAVAGVTYMLVWMRQHGSELHADLEAKAHHALARKSMFALVALAFLAVIREGIETAVFLFAILDGSSRVTEGIIGALLGIGAACALGYGIYRGGARIDLGRFFRVTGVVLVFVAAGLVAYAVHEFAELGWITWGQSPAVDLTSLIGPGTVQASLATAFLGLQPVPTYAEVFAWLAFAIPMTWYVLRPIGQRVPVSVN